MRLPASRLGEVLPSLAFQLLLKTLEMRRNPPASIPFPPSAYVFGGRDWPPRGQRQTRVANGRPESPWPQTGLDLEEEDGTE
jgi:hypothetical protein